MARRLYVLVVLAIALIAAGNASAGKKTNIWVGGGIGLGFGDVTYVSLEPLVGFGITPKFSVGVGGIYRFREDDRFNPSLRTNDYGLNTFVRYQLVKRFFVQGEYEWLNYEQAFVNGSTERDIANSVFGGFGFTQPAGRGGVYVTVLYNFTHDSDNSPYADPWAVRIGYAFNF